MSRIKHWYTGPFHGEYFPVYWWSTDGKSFTAACPLRRSVDGSKSTLDLCVKLYSVQDYLTRTAWFVVEHHVFPWFVTTGFQKTTMFSWGFVEIGWIETTNQRIYMEHSSGLAWPSLGENLRLQFAVCSTAGQLPQLCQLAFAWELINLSGNLWRIVVPCFFLCSLQSFQQPDLFWPAGISEFRVQRSQWFTTVPNCIAPHSCLIVAPQREGNSTPISKWFHPLAQTETQVMVTKHTAHRSTQKNVRAYRSIGIADYVFLDRFMFWYFCLDIWCAVKIVK